MADEAEFNLLSGASRFNFQAGISLSYQAENIFTKESGIQGECVVEHKWLDCGPWGPVQDIPGLGEVDIQHYDGATLQTESRKHCRTFWLQDTLSINVVS